MQRHPRSRGFTLIEVMVVIVIIGLLAASVVYNFAGESGKDRLEKEVSTLQAKIQLASELAMLKDVQLGWHIDDKGYRFLVFANDRWQVVGKPASLAPHQFPETVQATLELDGLPWAEENLLAEADFGQDDDRLFEDNSFDELKAAEEQAQQQKQQAEDDEKRGSQRDGERAAKKPRRTGIEAGPRQKSDPKLPQVFLLSSGEITPFRLTVRENSNRPLLQQQLTAVFSIPLERSEVELEP